MNTQIVITWGAVWSEIRGELRRHCEPRFLSWLLGFQKKATTGTGLERCTAQCDDIGSKHGAQWVAGRRSASCRNGVDCQKSGIE